MLKGNCKLTDGGLRELQKLSSLQKLDLSWCTNISAKGLEYLPESLTALNLSYTRVDAVALKHLTRLKMLDVSGNAMQR